MTPEQNERAFKIIMRDHTDARFNRHVEEFIAIVMLALFGATAYAATHIPQIEEAHQWLRDFLN